MSLHFRKQENLFLHFLHKIKIFLLTESRMIKFYFQTQTFPKANQHYLMKIMVFCRDKVKKDKRSPKKKNHYPLQQQNLINLKKLIHYKILMKFKPTLRTMHILFHKNRLKFQDKMEIANKLEPLLHNQENKIACLIIVQME